MRDGIERGKDLLDCLWVAFEGQEDLLARKIKAALPNKWMNLLILQVQPKGNQAHLFPFQLAASPPTIST